MKRLLVVALFLWPAIALGDLYNPPTRLAPLPAGPCSTTCAVGSFATCGGVAKVCDNTGHYVTSTAPPSGSAGGSLAGSFPNPTIAADAVGTTELAAGAVTDAKVASVAWSKLTSVPSTFTPAAHAATHASGGSDPVTLTEAQITGLAADLASKATAGANSNITSLSGLTTPISAAQGGSGLSYAAPVTLTTIAAPVAAVTAALSLGGTKLPARAFTVSTVRAFVVAAGTGGSSNATIRVTDGSSNCDSAFACNSASLTPISVAPTGSCAFSSGAALKVSVTSIGDCAIGPILGNIDVVGNWQ